MRHKAAAAQAAFTPPTKQSPNVATFRDGLYNTGISEQDIEQKAIEDGQSGVLDPAVVGVNSHPHAIDGLVYGHNAAASVIGYDTRDELQVVDGALEKEMLNFESTKAGALDANSNYESAERERILQWRRMKVTGLPVPSKKASIILIAAMVGLFVGDWGLITLGYQVLGLSDHPWIPGFAFTDDLHLAAFSSVFALVVLGEGVGDRLRRIEYSLDNRRLADEAEREKLAKPAAFDFFWLAVCFVGAVTGLIALSSIRSDYLRALGEDTGGLAFFGIQLTILLAAIALGFVHTNPEAKRWKSIDKKANTAKSERTTTTDAHTASGSRVNAAIDQRNAILAKAGHHVGADAANVGTQASAFKRRYLLSQLEPAQEQLFGEHKATNQHTVEDLLAQITGIKPIADFEKVTTTEVMKAFEKTRTKLDTLRARIDQLEIDKLGLPDLIDEGDLTETDADKQTSKVTVEKPAATPLRPVRPVDETSDDDTTEETA